MTLTRDDVIDILTAASSVDLRKVGPSDVDAWGSTLRTDLTRELAIEAVRIHYATNAERIMPAHVNAIAIKTRREQAEREDATARRKREDERDRRLGLNQGDPQLGGLPIAGANGNPVPGAYEVNGAVDRPCPTCKAQPMEPCTNPHTGGPRKMPCLRRLTNKTAGATA